MLRRRKALCEEYAVLFNEMCTSVDLDSRTVHGYTKTEFDFFTNDSLYRADHAWNLVDVNEAWQLMDITWAAGYVDFRKQIIRRSLYVAFRIPYRPKYRFYKRFEPAYLFSDPHFFLTEHLLVVPAKQLLVSAMSVDTFIAGDSLFKEQLSLKGEVDFNSYALQLAIHKAGEAELIFKGNATYAYNVENHREKGIYYGESVQLFIEKHIEEDKLVASELELEQCLDRLIVSDSFLNIAIQDFKIELKTKVDRSSAWSDSLALFNKTCRIIAKERSRENRRQKNQSFKAKNLNKKGRKFTKLQLNRLDPAKISKVRKLQKPKKGADSLATVYLQMADSCKRFADSLLILKNAVIKMLDRVQLEEIVPQEKLAFKEHKYLKKKLRNHVGGKRWWFQPYVHYTNSEIEKRWILSSLKSADSINSNYTQPLLDSLVAFQNQLIAIMQLYVRTCAKEHRYIIMAKRSAYKSYHEDELYANSVLKEQNELTKFIAELKEWKVFLFRFRILLNRANRKLRRTKSYLAMDIKLERDRHSFYRGYRRHVLRVETGKVNLYRAQVKRMSRFVSKELKSIQEDK